MRVSLKTRNLPMATMVPNAIETDTDRKVNIIIKPINLLFLKSCSYIIIYATLHNIVLTIR